MGLHMKSLCETETPFFLLFVFFVSKGYLFGRCFLSFSKIRPLK